MRGVRTIVLTGAAFVPGGVGPGLAYQFGLINEPS
jgi:hypothetical protein